MQLASWHPQVKLILLCKGLIVFVCGRISETEHRSTRRGTLCSSRAYDEIDLLAECCAYRTANTRFAPTGERIKCRVARFASGPHLWWTAAFSKL